MHAYRITTKLYHFFNCSIKECVFAYRKRHSIPITVSATSERFNRESALVHHFPQCLVVNILLQFIMLYNHLKILIITGRRKKIIKKVQFHFVIVIRFRYLLHIIYINTLKIYTNNSNKQENYLITTGHGHLFTHYIYNGICSPCYTYVVFILNYI